MSQSCWQRGDDLYGFLFHRGADLANRSLVQQATSPLAQRQPMNRGCGTARSPSPTTRESWATSKSNRQLTVSASAQKRWLDHYVGSIRQSSHQQRVELAHLRLGRPASNVSPHLVVLYQVQQNLAPDPDGTSRQFRGTFHLVPLQQTSSEEIARWRQFESQTLEPQTVHTSSHARDASEAPVNSVAMCKSSLNELKSNPRMVLTRSLSHRDWLSISVA